mmetsp:Transcript_74652/g.139373  ORF Transcript_74652/g.139373 Transcript_74652/m.139373 type:complete len:246 (-) Transcript_74652:97-834(-)
MICPFEICSTMVFVEDTPPAAIDGILPWKPGAPGALGTKGGMRTPGPEGWYGAIVWPPGKTIGACGGIPGIGTWALLPGATYGCIPGGIAFCCSWRCSAMSCAIVDGSASSGITHTALMPPVGDAWDTPYAAPRGPCDSTLAASSAAADSSSSGGSPRTHPKMEETPSMRMSPASATASFTAPTAPFSLKSCTVSITSSPSMSPRLPTARFATVEALSSGSGGGFTLPKPCILAANAARSTCPGP